MAYTPGNLLISAIQWRYSIQHANCSKAMVHYYDNKSCEKNFILNSFKIRGGRGLEPVVKFKIANFSFLFT